MGSYQVSGVNPAARFTLKLHRGDGMCLIAMNWKKGRPPADFVGFAIEYKEPGGDRFYAVKNRLAFLLPDGTANPVKPSSLLAPIQMFRWVHFPRNADLAGAFTYRVTPVFMNGRDELSYGDPQTAGIELARETCPGLLNVAFTRGFVSSQAFVDRYVPEGQDPDQVIRTLLPRTADEGLGFVATNPDADEAYPWMGFEARSAVLQLLDEAIADPTARVRAVVFDLNEPAIVQRFEALGTRLRIIIDDAGAHGKRSSAETAAAERLAHSATLVSRQHMASLQHNKTIVVDGETVQACLCGSTNLSWRGFFVQNNHAVIVRGPAAVKLFMEAYDNYEAHGDAPGFAKTTSSAWHSLGLKGIDAQIGFSPRSKANAVLKSIADDIAGRTSSSLFFSLAFLYQTPGPIRDAITAVRDNAKVFSYGISDHAVKGLSDDGGASGAVGVEVQKPAGTVVLVSPRQLAGDVPKPFKAEPSGGSGTRMHHKFIVIDFNKPTARVYLGSFNFSSAADTSNGENLLLIRDRRIATSFMIEAVRIFDHYHFRGNQAAATQEKRVLHLAKPPRGDGETPWWEVFYTDARKTLDRKMFA
jgi:hypothetical protein